MDALFIKLDRNIRMCGSSQGSFGLGDNSTFATKSVPSPSGGGVSPKCQLLAPRSSLLRVLATCIFRLRCSVCHNYINKRYSVFFFITLHVRAPQIIRYIMKNETFKIDARWDLGFIMGF